MDPTAIIVMRHTRAPLQTYTVDDKKHTTRQNIEEQFDVVHAERIALGTLTRMSLPMSGRCSLARRCETAAIWSSISPAWAALSATCSMPLAYARCGVDHGGNRCDETDGRRWSVAKALLITGVDARLHSGELRFAAELAEAHALAEELKDFRRHLTAAGRATYQARTGSMMISCWRSPSRCGGPSSGAGTGSSSGRYLVSTEENEQKE